MAYEADRGIQPIPDYPVTQSEETFSALQLVVAGSEQNTSATVADTGNQPLPEKAPVELPEEVWARFSPQARIVLSKLIAHSGQEFQPRDLKLVFPKPDASGTGSSLSQYLKSFEKDADTSPWFYRWGNGKERYCMWGTPEEAAYKIQDWMTTTDENKLEKHRNRVRAHRDRQAAGNNATSTVETTAKQAKATEQASTITEEPQSAFTGGMGIPAERFEAIVSDKQRDAKRGAMVLRAWGMKLTHNGNDVQLSIGREVLAKADTTAAELVEAVAESHDSLAPSDIRDMLSEYRERPLGLKTIIDLLDFLRNELGARNISGWKDTGPVANEGDGRRLVRFDVPEPTAG